MSDGAVTPATVVLVHGAWHGAWCWDKVVPMLETRGIPVVAIDLPGHGASTEPIADLATDAAALTATLAGIDGPVVVCGHSYGGAVLAEGVGAGDQVRHLVFIAAFPLDVGESCASAAVGQVEAADSESLLGPALQFDDAGNTTLAPDGATAAFFHDCSADDVAFALARLGPQSMAELEGEATRAAWRDRPSTYAVCVEDRAVPPALQRVLARRATGVVEWPTSHSPFLSRPELVADLLTELAAS